MMCWSGMPGSFVTTLQDDTKDPGMLCCDVMRWVFCSATLRATRDYGMCDLDVACRPVFMGCYDLLDEDDISPTKASCVIAYGTALLCYHLL